MPVKSVFAFDKDKEKNEILLLLGGKKSIETILHNF
jgi:hypothetical protein